MSPKKSTNDDFSKIKKVAKVLIQKPSKTPSLK